MTSTENYERIRAELEPVLKTTNTAVPAHPNLVLHIEIAFQLRRIADALESLNEAPTQQRGEVDEVEHG